MEGVIEGIRMRELAEVELGAEEIEEKKIH